MKEILIWACIILILIFATPYVYEHLVVMYRAISNRVFKQSEQYQDGMIFDLESLYIEYSKGDENQKAVIKEIFLRRVITFPQENLPKHLKIFYRQLKSN